MKTHAETHAAPTQNPCVGLARARPFGDRGTHAPTQRGLRKCPHSRGGTHAPTHLLNIGHPRSEPLRVKPQVVEAS